jgi:hypothetical protein
MSHSILKEARSLEEAFFLKHDARLIEEMRRREATLTQKKALTEVSGITDEKLLDRLIAHEIHAESLAAFALVPIVEVAWSDGAVHPGETAVILRAVEDFGVQKGSLAHQLVEEWMTRRPESRLMQCWLDYTRVLLQDLPPEDRESLRNVVLKHARAVAEAAGGFLGYGRVSDAEAKMLRKLEEAFRIVGA